MVQPLIKTRGFRGNVKNESDWIMYPAGMAQIQNVAIHSNCLTQRSGTPIVSARKEKVVSARQQRESATRLAKGKENVKLKKKRVFLIKV